MIPVRSWSEFLELQANNAEASANKFTGAYELHAYWSMQAHDFRALATWLAENSKSLPPLPDRTSL
jgi:hypothetical protein